MSPSPHSFDPARPRRAPTSFEASREGGERRVVTLSRVTLIVAVKPQCEGCRSFLSGDYEPMSNIDLLFVSAVADVEWSKVPRDVVVAPEFLNKLGITSAPFYALVDPSAQKVLTEGVVFDPAQVSEEIARYLTT